MSFSFLCVLIALVLQSNSAQAHQPFLPSLKLAGLLAIFVRVVIWFVAGESRYYF
jgi:hypothetical protein